jgi:hypothetical protein
VYLPAHPSEIVDSWDLNDWTVHGRLVNKIGRWNCARRREEEKRDENMKRTAVREDSETGSGAGRIAEKCRTSAKRFISGLGTRSAGRSNAIAMTSPKFVEKVSAVAKNKSRFSLL